MCTVPIDVLKFNNFSKYRYDMYRPDTQKPCLLRCVGMEMMRVISHAYVAAWMS